MSSELLPYNDTESPFGDNNYKKLFRKTSELIEFIAQFIWDFRTKSWDIRMKLVLMGFTILFNPKLAKWFCSSFNIHLTEKYNNFFWIMFSFFLAISVILLLYKRSKGKRLLKKRIDIKDSSPIKGLNAFDFADSEIFKKLQRNNDVNKLLGFIIGSEFRIGVLIGESGCGKTSFLKAGLSAAFKEKNIASVVVKLTNEDPLISFKNALVQQHQQKKNNDIKEKNSLKEILEIVFPKNGQKQLIIIFDQFEQFFTHCKKETDRKPFIEQMKECYNNLWNIKILISIRIDYAGWLHEVEEVIGYNISAMYNYYHLKKFDCIQTLEIFKVIAREENIDYNELFIKEIVQSELASSIDGRVLATDIQMVAFILNELPTEEKSFTKIAFQKLGGINGLLESFLRTELENKANRHNNDFAALNILLAFINHKENVRAGGLTINNVVNKVKYNTSRVEQIIEWLQTLRLINKIECNGNELAKYELTHERLIIPILSIASLNNIDENKVNQLIEQRTNQWIVEKKNRFLPSWKEYFFIRKNWKKIIWDRNKFDKENMLKAANRNIRRQIIISSTFLALSLGIYLTFQSDWVFINYKIKWELKKNLIGLNDQGKQITIIDTLARINPSIALEMATEFNNPYINSTLTN